MSAKMSLTLFSLGSSVPPRVARLSLRASAADAYPVSART